MQFFSVKTFDSKDTYILLSALPVLSVLLVLPVLSVLESLYFTIRKCREKSSNTLLKHIVLVSLCKVKVTDCFPIFATECISIGISRNYHIKQAVYLGITIASSYRLFGQLEAVVDRENPQYL